MLQQVGKDEAEALRRAADAERRAKQVAGPKLKADHERMAQSWRLLARSYEIQHAIARFISFQKSHQVTRRGPVSGTRPPIRPAQPELKTREAVFLDRLARRIDAIPPLSAAALGIAITAVSAVTVLRWLSGPAVDLRFGIYVAAILATGLLAGVPAAIGTTFVSIVVAVFAFVPPYYTFKWTGADQGAGLVLAAVASLFSIYLAHCCRVVLRLLRQREIANQILVHELDNRGKNMFCINQVILRRSLAHDPQRADQIIGCFRAVQNANNLLNATTARPITFRDLLSIEFAPYGENRFVVHGPEIEVAPEAIRHLSLILHELTARSAQHGALSSPDGRIKIEWKWNGGRRIAFTWTERGGPDFCLPHPDFDNELIASCVQALDGSFETRFDRGGCSSRIAARIR